MWNYSLENNANFVFSLSPIDNVTTFRFSSLLLCTCFLEYNNKITLELHYLRKILWLDAFKVYINVTEQFNYGALKN